jgi:hypothetical protein
VPTLGGGLSQLWAFGAAILLAVLALWQYTALRSRIPVAKALLLTVLRCASIALVLVLLAGPRIVRRTFNRVRRPIAVAVDTSRSMGLRGGLASTRLDRARDFLQSREYRDVASGFVAGHFSFAESVAPVAPEGIGALRPDGPRTDLAGALREAGAAGSPAAVVLFTDGGHGTGARAEALPALPDVPLVIVGVGAGERTVDAEISSVAPPAIAFAGQPLQIQVLVRASGLAGRSVPLLLKRGEQVLVSRTVALPADGEEVHAALEWTPQPPEATRLPFTCRSRTASRSPTTTVRSCRSRRCATRSGFCSSPARRAGATASCAARSRATRASTSSRSSSCVPPPTPSTCRSRT